MNFIHSFLTEVDFNYFIIVIIIFKFWKSEIGTFSVINSLWAPGEPDNMDARHDCVEIKELSDNEIHLYDVSCSRKLNIICERDSN